jgi:hypothetical protein
MVLTDSEIITNLKERMRVTRRGLFLTSEEETHLPLMAAVIRHAEPEEWYVIRFDEILYPGYKFMTIDLNPQVAWNIAERLMRISEEKGKDCMAFAKKVQEYIQKKCPEIALQVSDHFNR